MISLKPSRKQKGFDVKLVNTPWEGIFATLSSGDRDILISGITITDKRKNMVDFSNPYFPAEQAIVISETSDVKDLNSLKELNVGVVNSSTGDIVVSDVIGKTVHQLNVSTIHRFYYKSYLKMVLMQLLVMLV